MQATVRKYESRIFSFPLVDFNSAAQPGGGAVASGNSLTSLPIPLVLPSEAWWAVFGVSATACTISAGGLASGSLINIQILDVESNRYLVTYAGNFQNIGAPLEHVAGKYGNPHWLAIPWIVRPGSRLVLSFAQNSGGSSTGRTPMYVALHAMACDNPNEAAALTLGSWNQQMKEAHGRPWSLTTKFVFSGATSNNLLVGQSRSNLVPVGDGDFFIDSIVARGGTSQITQTYINTLDPRVTEPELLFSLRDSERNAPFMSPDPVPISLAAGMCGAREFSPPSHFFCPAKASLIPTLYNKTAATISTDMELTFSGAVLDRG